MPDHRPATQPPVAIVGLGVLFPKSPDLASYWRNIVGAVDCISDVPSGHSWSAADYYDPDPNKPDKTWATRGGFVEPVPFDPLAHGVSPAALESIDTTQLLSLIVARECLRDAGLDPDSNTWDRDRVACILGITGTQEMAITAGSRLQGPIWRKALERCGITGALQDAVVADIGNHFPTWTEQTFPGLLGNVVAGRIANRLDLGGTNCVVDAACASSLAAMQYAVGELASGRADVVLSGGADMLNDAFMFQCFTRTPAFSKTGDPRPFDADADGILIGEGIAVVAMKRLEDAERDGDRIYAVLRGLGSSSDGRGASIYAPVSKGQAKALRRTYAMAGIGPETIELVEAHGTGTKAGDAAEIAGLKSVYADAGRSDRWVALGSVKSQVGHTKSTAGAAGLVKAVLALHHRVLPPTAKVDLPNPKMAFEASPFYLSGRARPWIRAADHPRRAAVSAFGFGGSNFHAVLEEHGSPTVRASWAAEGELFLVGADSTDALRGELDAIAASDAPTLSHRAREVQARWSTGRPEVLGFVATSHDDLLKKLDLSRRLLDGSLPKAPGIWRGTGLGAAPTVAFVFPGQGSQYVEMGRTASLRHPELRAALDAADEHARAAGDPSLSSVVFPPPGFTPAETEAQEAALRRTERAQPALGALSAGFLDVLAGFGVHPDLAAGHSYGELVALHAAGALDRDALFTASRHRGRRMADLPSDLGTMAAVTGPLDRIAALIADIPDLVLANRNTPEQGVIAGPKAAVDAGLAALKAAGLDGKPISVGAAFHSPLVAAAAAPFAADLAALPMATPAIPVWSTVTARPHADDPDAIRAALVAQITAPVDWVGVVEGLYAAGARVFVECGPKGVLGGLASAILGQRAATVISVDGRRDKVDGDVQLKEALCALAAAGVPVDLAPLLAERLPAPPRTAGSAATTWLAGANYKRPETLEPPMPVLPKAPSPAVAPDPRPVAPTMGADAGWAAIPSSGAPVGRPPALARSNDHAPAPAFGAPSPAFPPPTSALAAPGPVAGDVAALLESTRSTLAAFQAAQTRTAEVHARFLDAWAESSRSFGKLFETHARLVELAAGHPVAPLAHGLAASVPAAPALPPVAFAAPSPSPIFPGPEPIFADPTSELSARRGSDAMDPDPFAPTLVTPPPAWFLATSPAAEPGRVGAPATAASVAAATDLPPLLDAAMAVEAKSAPRPAAAPTAPRGPSRDVLVDATLAAVATKTGYPRAMLELSMDLESDLGVDSIKRVEILGAVSDAVPGLPELDQERLGSLRTLDDVVAYLTSVAGAAPVGPPAPTVARPVSGPGRDVLIEATLTAVAAKTGYPRAMLELSMDLESDLGVDSIKRVEILGAVSDAVPGLPELDQERLGALRTLEDVVAYLTSVAGAGAPPELSNPLFHARRPTPRANLEGALLDAVAAKTGYPRAMLELSMDLESDLGVDSIKRVEILGAVTEAIPGLPELDNEVLGSLRRLSDVLDHLAAVDAGLGFAHLGAEAVPADPSSMYVVPPPAPVPAPTVAVEPTVHAASDLIEAAPVALRRRVVEVVAAPAGQPVGIEGPVLVTADHHGRAEALAAVLRARGHEVVVFDPDWTVDALTVPVARSVVHLAAAGAIGDDLRARVRGGFLLAKAVGPKVSLFATVSAMGGRFGQDQLLGDWLEGALAGLPKTLSQEWPATRCLALDVAEEVDGETLADALLTDRGAIEVGLDPSPVVLRTVAAALGVSGSGLPLAAGDLVVVSGGARGVTAAVVLELAKRTHAAFLLLGRSAVVEDPAWAAGVPDSGLQAAWLADRSADGQPTSPKAMKTALDAVRSAREVRSTLAAIHGAGGTARYAAVDARDGGAVEAVVAAAVADLGPVRGLIHGAGVLADKLLVDKPVKAFDEVFATKVDGWNALLDAVDPTALKVAVLFGSVAGRFGNVGQVDYAMANEALAHAAMALRTRGVRAVTVAWGPWAGGMVTPELERAFARRGLGTIPLGLGAAALADELERGHAAEVVIEGPRPGSGTLTRRFGLASDPWLADHSLGGHPVVPVAVVLEWLAQVAREVFPGLKVVAVRDLAVLKGIVLDGGPAELMLSWSPAAPRDGGHALVFEVLGAPGPLGQPTLHYRAVVDLAESRPEVGRFPGSNGLGANPYPHALADAYDRFLFHGPAFRAIESIEGISDHGLVGRLRGHGGLGRGGTWTTDPVALDATLQLLLLWVRERTGLGALPSMVKEYRQFRDFPEQVACHLEVERLSDRRGRFTATLVGNDDAVIAVLGGGEYAADPSLAAAFLQR